MTARSIVSVIRVGDHRPRHPMTLNTEHFNSWPTDEEGERALKALRESLPSLAQTRYNQRDIKKRRKKKLALDIDPRHNIKSNNKHRDSGER